MEEVTNLINVGPANPIQILNQHYFFEDFVFDLQMIILAKKILLLVLGLRSKDGKSTRDKSNINNHKVNRGCPPLTANRITADCVQISSGPSIKSIPLRVYHTEGFNAMQVRMFSHRLYNVVDISINVSPHQRHLALPPMGGSLGLNTW